MKNCNTSPHNRAAKSRSIAKSILAMTALAAVLSTSLATPSSANHRSSAQFETAIQDYGRNVSRGARNYYDRYGDRVRDWATQKAVNKTLSRAGRTVITRTGIGIIVDLAWPRCVGENC